jgi:hypothetical protein
LLSFSSFILAIPSQGRWKDGKHSKKKSQTKILKNRPIRRFFFALAFITHNLHSGQEKD